MSISGSAASIPTLADAGNVTGSPTTGQILSYDGSNWSPTDSASARRVVTYTAVGIQPDIATDISITTPKTYALLRVELSHACWLTLYTDTASRTADAARLETTDPTPGSGVLSEVITTSAATQLISPGTICYNNTASNVTYAKLVNRSGGQVNLQVQLTLVPLEA